MVTKIKYCDCKTSGMGHCWYCDNKTNYILDSEKEEIFCCLACAVKNYKSKKLHRKVRSFERLRDTVKASKISENSKNLCAKKEQNAVLGTYQ